MPLIWYSIIISVVGLIFAGYLAMKLLKQKIADEKAKVVADYIRRGTTAFLSKEYRILFIFTVVIALILFVIPSLSWPAAILFIIGVIIAGVSGFVGMYMATRANLQTAQGCSKGLLSGLAAALSAGQIMGLLVASLGLLATAIIYMIFADATIIFCFALGVSLVALFARVGGGIYTKAADIGADCAGKIEAGIPEDDARNPAVIADNTGDIVGDFYGMSADLFESYIDSILAAIILGTIFLPLYGSRAVILPLMIATSGIIIGILATLSIKKLKGKPNHILNGNAWFWSIIMMAVNYFIVRLTVGDINIFWPLLSGLVAGLIIGLITEYYTSNKNKPTKKLAYASQTGSAINVISGISLGFMSTIVPSLVIIITIFISYKFAGLYGLAIASMGMLATLAMNLATNIYGPIADNALGIAHMSGGGSETRKCAEELDTVGNTRSAIGKGISIVAATLTSLTLFIVFSYLSDIDTLNLMNIQVLIGLFLGCMVAFVFAALSMKSVSRAAAKMVTEIRRQFKEITGLMSGAEEPDYNRCISISTGAALKEMSLLGLIAIILPIIIGFYLGVESLAGFLIGSIIVGFLLAISMTNAGSAWDNAKKFIESGNVDENTDTLNSAIVGDTVGDPFKDTAGPALNVLIKLMIIISLIVVPFLL